MPHGFTGIEALLEHNRQQSELYCSPDATLARQLYRAQHPTEVCALKCMDGRLNLALITHTQAGIIQPWRNLGGRFDLGWPYFGSLVMDWTANAVNRGRDCLVLVTYHFSKGDPHRGCKGFGYDKEAAVAHTKGIKEQFERMFGAAHTVLYPVQVGIETDEDALLIHGENGEILDLSALPAETPAEEMESALSRLFPDMKERVRKDFLPLLLGNLEHIAENREANRPIAEVSHQETVLAVGRGFDWLHKMNTALIVGPFSPNLSEPIRVAASLILENIHEKRIDPSQGIVLMVSSVTPEPTGPARHFAEEKSAFLAELSMQVIREQVPELLPHLKTVVGVVNTQTREFIRQKFQV